MRLLARTLLGAATGFTIAAFLYYVGELLRGEVGAMILMTVWGAMVGAVKPWEATKPSTKP